MWYKEATLDAAAAAFYCLLEEAETEPREGSERDHETLMPCLAHRYSSTYAQTLGERDQKIHQTETTTAQQ